MRNPCAGLVLTLAVMSATACGGAANNAAWVREPEGGGALGEEPAAFDHESSLADATSDSAPQGGPQRLNHTVTLGQVMVAPPDPAAPGGAQGPGSLTINVINYTNSAPYGYGGYGYGYAGVPFVGRFAGGSPSSPVVTPHGGGASIVQPGQSWPAPASHGPSFPYSTSPASPWETRR
jgi:hypothetical protein